MADTSLRCYQRLDAVLARQRELLAELELRLARRACLPPDADHRWVERAVAAIEESRNALRELEVLRALEADALAAALSLPAGARLLELAATAPPVPAAVLRAHHGALLPLTVPSAPHGLATVVPRSLRDFLVLAAAG